MAKNKRIISWNVNGIRAVYKKSVFEWFSKESPDIICLQETKANEDQLPKEIRKFEGYNCYFAAAAKKGYSGVALFSKQEPLDVKKGFGIEEFDSEGRTIIAEYKKCVLFNIYFPNGKASPERLKYKMDFYDAFLAYADNLRSKGKSIIVCGDVNTAHTEIDLARPKENETESGFLPQERAWIDKLISHGYIDTFRMFTKEGEHYSWWDYKTGARERNIGWRIDYFFASSDILPKIKDAFIMKDIMGSDHCPVAIDVAGDLF